MFVVDMILANNGGAKYREDIVQGLIGHIALDQEVDRGAYKQIDG